MASPASDDDCIVLVDDEGREIDGTTESSLLMAMDFPDLIQCTATEAGFKHKDDRPAPGSDTSDNDDTPEDDTMTHANSWQREDTELTVESIVRRSKFKGELCYLVKYSGHEEPIWESATYLSDEGYQPLLDAFCLQRTTTKKVPKKKRKDFLALAHAAFDTTVPKDHFNVLQRFPRLVEDICQRFLNTAHTVIEVKLLNHSIYEGNRSPPLTNFTEKLGENTHHSIELLFHGTRKENIESVSRRGLLVPGPASGIGVANGSAHGIGIYTARTPNIPLGYCRGSSEMFVVGGLVGSKVTMCGEVCVFFDSSLVCPLALVRFIGSNGQQNNTVRVTVEKTEHVIPDFPVSVKRAPVNAAPVEIRDGPKKRHEAVESRHKFMTKRDLRAAPRYVKEQFKEGLIPHPKH